MDQQPSISAIDWRPPFNFIVVLHCEGKLSKEVYADDWDDGYVSAPSLAEKGVHGLVGARWGNVENATGYLESEI